MTSIPYCQEPSIYKKTSFVDSRFIEIKTNDLFDVCMQYPLLGMQYAEKKCLVRGEVYKKLCNASKNLPQGYKLRIWDAWRPFSLQKELVDVYSEKIIQEFHLANSSEETKQAMISKFVSLPIPDRNTPPVHTTGGAVDVTIIDSSGQELEMGTGFDAFTEKTNTSYFESSPNTVIKNNRRLLYSIMIQAGFTNLPSEWWHYDYGDRFWAFYKKVPAIFNGIFNRVEMNEKRKKITKND